MARKLIENVFWKSPVIIIICSGFILETGRCWQAHCSPIDWYVVSTKLSANRRVYESGFDLAMWIKTFTFSVLFSSHSSQWFIFCYLMTSTTTLLLFLISSSLIIVFSNESSTSLGLVFSSSPKSWTFSSVSASKVFSFSGSYCLLAHDLL